VAKAPGLGRVEFFFQPLKAKHGVHFFQAGDHILYVFIHIVDVIAELGWVWRVAKSDVIER
jgi:hypothetical protein